MIDRKILQTIKDEFNRRQALYPAQHDVILACDVQWLFDTIEELQDEVGSLDEQLDRCRREYD